MKTKLWILGSAVLLMGSQIALAQAPAGSTGQCKDGTYTNVAKKAGACSGHKGVQTWFAATSAPSAAPAKTSTPASAPAPAAKSAAPAPAPAPSPSATMAKPAAAAARSNAATQSPAPGGGPGMVWVNVSTKVYHCAGSRYYGKTKDGKYMAEADAIKMGAHADHGKGCSK